MTENPNPYIVPGRPRYNPAAQSQTETDMYMQQMYPGFVDPTQMPIMPGDTERPMYSPPPLTQSPASDSSGHRSQLQQVAQQMTSLYQSLEAASQPQHSAASVQPIRVPLVFDLTFNIKINLDIQQGEQ